MLMCQIYLWPFHYPQHLHLYLVPQEILTHLRHHRLHLRRQELYFLNPQSFLGMVL